MEGMFVFFQAEDGIRDIGVTGVQTCALPIFTFYHYPEVETVHTSYHWVAVPQGTGFAKDSETYHRRQIGRASCRERVQISVVAVSLKKTSQLLYLSPSS